MKEELKIPFVDKKIVEYLKDTYSASEMLYEVDRRYTGLNDSRAIGFMEGVNEVISRLNNIVWSQEQRGSKWG